MKQVNEALQQEMRKQTMVAMTQREMKRQAKEAIVRFEKEKKEDKIMNKIYIGG